MNGSVATGTLLTPEVACEMAYTRVIPKTRKGVFRGCVQRVSGHRSTVARHCLREGW